MRKYKPVELPLKDVPRQFQLQHATCPNCQDRDAGVPVLAVGAGGMLLLELSWDAFQGEFYRLVLPHDR